MMGHHIEKLMSVLSMSLLDASLLYTVYTSF